jgi:hypothetical protein
VYLGPPSSFGAAEIRAYSASDFALSPVQPGYTLLTTGKKAFAVDPPTGDVYVDKGNKIEVFDSSGSPIETFGASELKFSTGITVNGANGHVYANTEEERIVDFGYLDEPINNPAIVNAVRQSGVHNYGDFQVTPKGDFAAFASVLPLTGYDNGGHYELFRYGTDDGELICVSCNPTNARAVGDSALAPTGLSLVDDGRVFFNSSDNLAPRDLNSRQDTYEWSEGSVQLISPGTSAFPSGLLGVSANGRDAYFFTRDTLVPQDQNGTLTKIYDARAGGGFPFVPPPVSCKASDECHGPGTEAPGPPAINTIRGTKGNQSSHGTCKRGKVRRGGKCVKKPRRHKRHHERHAAHGAG